MHELNEHRVRARVGRILGRAAKLFCCSLQRSASRTSPMPARMAVAAVFTAAVASIAAVFTAAVASMTAAFTLARFTVNLADFMAADGMVASRASTMVSATATATTGCHGWRDGRYGWWWGDGLGWTYYPYGSDYYPDYGYYSSGEPSASQNWYYCSDPAGYYPYITQCNTGWQTVPAS